MEVIIGFFLLLIGVFLIFRAIKTLRVKAASVVVKQDKAISTEPSDRLSNSQIICLSSASETKPIYAKNPSRFISQLPNGAACFNIRTVNSLVKRGFLVSAQKGGYLLTSEGCIGLKRSMGFRD